MKAAKQPATNLRRALSATLACYFAGCAGSVKTTGLYQFNLIKRDMTREQVVANLGQPAQTDLVNGAPSEDLYSCDERDWIVTVRDTDLALANHILGVNECAVHYEHGKVVSTSRKNGPSNWETPALSRSVITQ